MSVFNIDRFRTELLEGGARPNQFAVTLTFPSYVQGSTAAGNSSEFLITAAELPGSTMGTMSVFYRGRELKMAGDMVFAPFAFSVLNDADFTIRRALEDWMNGIENRLNKTGTDIARDYQADDLVRQLDRNGNTLRTYTLRSAFPTEVGPVSLDFGANDQISTFQAVLQYQTFSVV
jgi:hypothetical protein